MRLNDIKYVSTNDKYTIMIVCSDITFTIPINKLIIKRHICSFDLDEVQDDLNMDNIFIEAVNVSYGIGTKGVRTLSVILTLRDSRSYTISAFDVNNTKLIPTISVSNTDGI